MDIKCERCGTEYEFENDRVTEDGVTVKCSTCGHLFKIRKKSFVLTEPVVLSTSDQEEAKGRNWMVRRTNGTILSFKELTTLQKWIVECKVSEDDEISKTGETWKRLGSIAELSSFFKIVAQAGLSNPPPPDQAAGAAEPPTMVGRPDGQGAAPAEGAIPAAIDMSDLASGPDGPTTGESEIPFSLKGEGPVESGVWDEGGVFEQALSNSNPDVVDKWQRRGRRKWYLIVPLLLLLIGLGGAYLVAPDSFMSVVNDLIGKKLRPEIPAQARALLDSANRAYWLDSEPALTRAASQLEQALSLSEGQFAEAASLAAEVFARRAELLDQQIASATGSKENKIELARQSEQFKQTAGRFLNQARELAPDELATQRATAAVLRTHGAQESQVVQHLDAVRAVKPDDPELWYIQGAMAASRDAGQAIKDLERAIALQASAGLPDLVRARYLLARLLIAANQKDEARKQLRQIEKVSPDHGAARQLLASLNQPPPAPPSAEPKSPPKSPPPEPVPPPLSAEAPKSQPSSFDSWMNLADSLQRSGKARQALEAYQAALSIKPTHAEALAGVGLCYLDLGSNASAIKSFLDALKNNPTYGDAIIGLAEAYKFNGERDQAARYYQRYLDVLPGGPEASVARSNLKQLKPQ